MAKKKLTPAIDLLIPSAKLIKDNLPVFFVLLVIPLLLSSMSGPQPELAGDETFAELAEAMSSLVTPFVVIGSVLALLFYPLLTFAQLTAAKKGSVTLRQAAAGGLKHYWQLLGLLLIMIAVIGLGFVAFVIPGIIFLRCFILSPYYLLEDKHGILDAMRHSARDSKQYKWPIYSVIGVMLLFSLFSSFGLIGQIAGTILSVLYGLALALRFYEIQKLRTKN